MNKGFHDFARYWQYRYLLGALDFDLPVPGYKGAPISTAA